MLIALPVTVSTKTGNVFLRDAKGRHIAHFGEVRNVDGVTLPVSDWIEHMPSDKTPDDMPSVTPAGLAESVARSINQTEKETQCL